RLRRARGLEVGERLTALRRVEGLHDARRARRELQVNLLTPAGSTAHLRQPGLARQRVEAPGRARAPSQRHPSVERLCAAVEDEVETAARVSAPREAQAPVNHRL